MFKLLNRYWRIVATGFCFALFGLGGIVLTLTLFPLQRLFIGDEQKRNAAARLTVHYTFRFFIKVMSVVGISRWHIHGAERLSQIKGQVIIANHPSLIDVVVLIAHIKNADCVVKSHLFKNPFMRGVIQASGYISNSEPDKLIEDCERSLKAGNNIIIFPEGTRTTIGKPIKLQRGFANMAIRAKADLLFILIKVTPATLTKEIAWYNVPSRRFDFELQVKHTINISTYLDLAHGNTTKAVRQLTRDVETLFKQELSIS